MNDSDKTLDEEFAKKFFEMVFGEICEQYAKVEDNKMPALDIDYVDKIYVDEDARTVVTVFADKTKEVVKCSENDEFDVVVGVALGIARRLFGNHTNFYKKVVGKKAIYVKKKSSRKPSEYEIYRKWCLDNHKRLANEVTFKKNKNKYLAKMKGEN